MAVIRFARFPTVGMQEISGGGELGKVTTAGVDISMDAIAGVGIAGSLQVELSGVVGGLSDKEELRLRLKILFRESPLCRVR